MISDVQTACTRHCGDGCALIVSRQENGAISLRGNPAHPFTRGFMCAKAAQFAKHLTSSRRIVTPLVRVGDNFQEATWDEALAVIAEKIQSLRETPQRMLHLMGPASFGLLFKASKLLFGRLGASSSRGALCLAAGAEAQKRDFGKICQGPLNDIVKTRRIVNWGRNIAQNSVHLASLVRQARKNGARVLSIHPGDSGYASISDQELVLRPGTDRFLAAAVIQELSRRGALRETALRRCHAPQAFLERISHWRGEDFLASCDLDQDQVAMVADWYTGEPPTATFIGRGLQRYPYGGETVRFIDALAMLSGQVGRALGGVYYMQGNLGNAAWDWTQTSPGFSRYFRIATLAKEIEKADPAVAMIWVEGINLVTQCPDSHAVQKALAARFTVAVEAFMTDTARSASVILPPALMFECEDIVKNDFHEFINHAAQVLPPRGLARTNFAIAAAIGARLHPPIPYPSPEMVMEQALQMAPRRSSLAEIREKGWVVGRAVPAIPWQDGKFAHPDGLYRLPTTLHCEEHGPSPAFPLRLLSLVRKHYLLSQIPEEDQLVTPPVFISPQSPALAKLDLTRPIQLVTSLGAMFVQVHLTPGIHPEAVVIGRGGWLRFDGCINSLIEACEADMGGQTAYYSQAARLENYRTK